jgi:signal transduction histidine kinase
VEDLREIARGIHPAILSDGGLGPALRTLARRAAIPVELDVAAIGRLPEQVEVAAYYLVSEALTNATKHAHASFAEVGAQASGGVLRVRVRDNGVGGVDPLRGSGLVGLKDRIEALGGTFAVHSPAGCGTTVTCELPVSTGAGQPLPNDQRGAQRLDFDADNCAAADGYIAVGVDRDDHAHVGVQNGVVHAIAALQ